MKKTTKVIISIFSVASLMLSIESKAANGTGTATATIVTPIAISPTQDLAFGKISATGAGTVVIGNAGARSSTGGAVLVNTASTQTQATFAVSGQASATYAITLPGSAASITNGTDTMSVDTFTSNPSATGTLSGGGTQTVNVGGTLHVAGTESTGNYTGTFTVTVEYN